MKVLNTRLLSRENNPLFPNVMYWPIGSKDAPDEGPVLLLERPTWKFPMEAPKVLRAGKDFSRHAQAWVELCGMTMFVAHNQEDESDGKLIAEALERCMPDKWDAECQWFMKVSCCGEELWVEGPEAFIEKSRTHMRCPCCRKPAILMASV